MGSQKRDNIQGYSNQEFYKEGTALATWEKIDFINSLGVQFKSASQSITNDSAYDLDVSWDGKNVHARFKSGETHVWDFHVRKCIYLKSTDPANLASYRLMVW